VNDPYQSHIPAYWIYAQELRDRGIVGDEFNNAMAEWRGRHPEDQPGTIAAAQIKAAHERNVKNFPELAEEEKKS
jgi:hypothetical protein